MPLLSRLILPGFNRMHSWWSPSATFSRNEIIIANMLNDAAWRFYYRGKIINTCICAGAHIHSVGVLLMDSRFRFSLGGIVSRWRNRVGARRSQRIVETHTRELCEISHLPQRALYFVFISLSLSVSHSFSLVSYISPAIIYFLDITISCVIKRWSPRVINTLVYILRLKETFLITWEPNMFFPETTWNITS